MGRRRAPELYRAPFPLYALQVDPSTGLLIAAGGGGAAKTGIKNGVVPRSRGLDKGRGQPQQRRNLELKPIKREQNSE